ncbi:MAG: MFS transporter, partial [Candidatus Saccharimonadales bacterium]
TSAILGSIEPQQAGVGSAVNNAVSRIAGLVAIAGLALITGPALDLHGFHRGVLTLACSMIIGGLVSWFGIRNPKLAQKPLATEIGPS